MGVAWAVGDALAQGRLPDRHLATEDARLHGTMFDATLGVPTDRLWERWRTLVAAFPAYAFHQRQAHSIPGECVIVVGVAVSPGSSALTGALYHFRGARISAVESFHHPHAAFARARLPWPGLGGDPR